MLDARISSSLKQIVIDTRRGLVAFTRFLTGSTGLLVLLTLAVVFAHPTLRAHALQGITLVQSLYQPAQEVAAVGDTLPDDGGRDHVEAFLSAVGDATPLAALEARDSPGLHVAKLAALERYISRRYLVAPDAARMVVQAAYSVADEHKVDPLLLLSVAAIESRFNPFAQSVVGAQGLMQVMTRVHMDKFEPFGGAQAAFNPVANLWVGAQILADCIARAGSLEGGLRLYVGVGPGGETQYHERVLAERSRLVAAIARHAPPAVAAAAAPIRGLPAGAAPLPADG